MQRVFSEQEYHRTRRELINTAQGTRLGQAETKHYQAGMAKLQEA